MRLSDAISVGRLLPEAWSPYSFATCAIGMAQAALGIEHNERLFGHGAIKVWPWITKQIFKHPLGGSHEPGDAKTIITDLYHKVSDGGMTLDQLIDWVRSVEPPEATPEPTEAVCHERSGRTVSVDSLPHPERAEKG